MKAEREYIALSVLLLLLLLIVAAPAYPQSPDSSEQKSPPPHILIINSYHQGYAWSDNEIVGIKETLKKKVGKVELHIECLDSKNFPDNEHFAQLQALFAVKYRTHRPSVVIILDNPAFEFALTYRQQLFSGIPIVFAGLNDFTPTMLKKEKGVTGVVERQNFIGTIKLAQHLHPNLKEVVLLHDRTASGLASRREADEQLVALSASLKLTYLPDMTIAGINDILKKLQPGTIVLPFSYSRDKAGTVFNHAELARILSSNSPVPVYSTKEERLGYGILGGSLFGGKTHGAEAAELVVRILRGQNPDAIPVVTTPRSTPQFDYQQLQRFGIDPDRLPTGSEVINRPVNFYRQNPTPYNAAIAIVLILSAALGYVLYNNRRKIVAEEALVEAERGKARVLEAANREMEAFLYTISHDLQAPLRHITSYSDLIQEEYRDRLDEQGSYYLTRLKLASQKMSDLINDILSLSRIGKVELYRTPFDLGKLANDIFAGLQSQDSSRDVTLTVAADMKVDADRQLMTLALAHLISNAWKYTANTAHARILLGKEADTSRVIYFVRDNGVGFDMKYAEKLFAPFQRLHPDSEFEGGGVGLAMVQRIINRHGGQIWAESSPGEGATFFFTLQP